VIRPRLRNRELDKKEHKCHLGSDEFGVKELLAMNSSPDLHSPQVEDTICISLSILTYVGVCISMGGAEITFVSRACQVLGFMQFRGS